jgi:hypothetical protein
MDSGTIAFWVLSGSAFLAFVSVLLKLTWWKYTIGVWFFMVTGIFAFLLFFIFTLQLGFWPEPVRDQARAIIYGMLAIPFLVLVVDIWRKNPHHWAWSKDEHGT